MSIDVPVFISSKMIELAEERNKLYELLPSLDFGEIKLRPWIFEKDAPATSRTIRDVYLDGLKSSRLYIGLFWNEYGEWTIDEFNRATEWGIERHIYVKNFETNLRDPRLMSFLDDHTKVESGITPRWFTNIDELCEAVQKSIESWVYNLLAPKENSLLVVVADTPQKVPEQPDILIGRDKLIEDIEPNLEPGNQVLLVGFPGVGKTAVAAHIAAKRISATSSPVIWVKAGSHNIEAILDSLVRRLRPHSPENTTGMKGGVKAQEVHNLVLASEASLVVIDDIWDGQTLHQLVKTIPHTMPILITSRHNYWASIVIELDDLSDQAAIELLNFYSARKWNRDPDAVELCTVLGNLPFALEIAGKTLKVRKWKPRKLLHRIKNSPHTLKVPLDYSEMGRGNVADLLEVSLKTLSPAARRLFFIFGGLFVPTVTLELLRLYHLRLTVSFGWEPWQLADLRKNTPSEISDVQMWHLLQRINLSKTIEVLDLENFEFSLEDDLAELIDRGLVHTVSNDYGVDSYRLHTLAFSYAKAQIKEQDIHCLVDVCVIFVEKYCELDPLKFPILTKEFDNLSLAAQWALENHRQVDARELIDCLTSESISPQGFTTKGIKLLEKGVEEAKRISSREDTFFYINRLGVLIGAFKSDPERGKEYLQEAMLIAQEAKSAEGEATVLSNLATLHFMQNEHAIAEEYFRKAIVIQENSGLIAALAATLGNLASIYFFRAEYEHVIEYGTRSLELFKKLKKGYNVNLTYNNLGMAHHRMGNWAEATRYFQEALEMTTSMGDKYNETRVLYNLGDIARDKGHLHEAMEYAKRALATAESINADDAIAAATELITQLKIALDQPNPD